MAESGKCTIQLAHPEDREPSFMKEERFLEGEPHEFEARLLRHDGSFAVFYSA